MYVLIRYYAVRDEQGTYLGTLEVSQNIAPIQRSAGTNDYSMSRLSYSRSHQNGGSRF